MPSAREIIGGSVAATSERTAQAGAEMLRRGGNAADAACAAMFAACVAEFSLVSIGGSGVATVRLARDQREIQKRDAVAYDFFSAAPGLGAPVRDPRDLELLPVTIDFGVQKQTFHCGNASVAVPGLVAGLGRVWENHGSLPWKEILEPAIELASEPLRFGPTLWVVAQIVSPVLRVSEEARAIFMPDGRFDNERGWAQTDLAETLRRLAEAGAQDFYTGEIAERIAQDQRRRGGLVTPEDLASYEVLELEPRVVRYRDATVALPPAPSWGGRLIAYTLALLEGADLRAAGRRSSEHVASVAEAMRATDRARRAHSGDLEALSEPAVIEEGRALMRDALRRHEKLPPAMEPLPGGSPNTTQVSAVDSEGRAVSITASTGVGSGTVVTGMGILLNNMLGEQDLNPDGFHMRPPGDRMSTMMSPCVAERSDGEMALGSAGSNRIRSAIAQAISNWVDFGLSPDACANNARVHFEDDMLQVEEPEPGLVESLQARGYEVVPWPQANVYFGGVNIARLSQGAMSGAGDRRRGGASETVPPSPKR